jgi:hypothetical protein
MKITPEAERLSAEMQAAPGGEKRFETLTRRLLAVPKAELDKAMKADREQKQGRKSA